MLVDIYKFIGIKIYVINYYYKKFKYLLKME